MSIKKYASLEEFLKDYEGFPQSFNMLVDIQSVQEFSELYRPVINLVQISTDPEDGDIYFQKNAMDPFGKPYPQHDPRFSLTNRGLMKIRAAADAQFVEIRTEADHKNQVVTAFATMEFHSPTGGWARFTDSKAKSMVTTFRNGNKSPDVEAAQKAIAGAQNRCIRKVFNIKNHYSKGQLENPFVIVYVELNDKIPEVRQAKILAAVAPNALLYGLPSRQTQPQIAQQQKPAQITGTRVDPETGEVIDGGER